MTIRLLKFDVVHPADYLRRKQVERPDLEDMPLAKYRDWLIGLRSNYSDFYTHWLNEAGGWVAEEFFLNDDLFLQKVAREVFGATAAARRHAAWVGRRLGRRSWQEVVVAAYIDRFRPDAVFARSNPIPSRFWYERDALAISRLSARLPWEWHPDHFDLLFTDDPTFRAFFEMHGVPTLINRQGIDPRIPGELNPRSHRFDAVFVGGLGTRNFSRRTRFLAELADRTRIDLWGYWWDETGPASSIESYPSLASRFHGPTSGLEMYQLFRDADIVLNDYVDLDEQTGIGYNQRMFEAMGAGGFLLTREAANLAKDFPADIFVTFDGLEDCLDKIAYFQRNERERDEIARAGQRHVLEHFNFRDIALDFGEKVRNALDRRSDPHGG